VVDSTTSGLPPSGIVLVGTPIGNLGDLSPRAVRALEAASVVACEDTRRARVLLSYAGVPARQLVVLNSATEKRAVARLIEAARRGALVAVVSDAGMPGVSDPGSRLVRAAVRAKLPVSVVPGPSAVVAALALAGFGGSRFCFEGFLPRRGAHRRERLGHIASSSVPVVLFEAPSRLVATLGDLALACGELRPAFVGRELTKLHETLWWGSLGEAVSWASSEPMLGECAIVVGGTDTDEVADPEAVRQAMSEELARGVSLKQAAKAVAERLGVARTVAYQAGVELRHEDQPR